MADVKIGEEHAGRSKLDGISHREKCIGQMKGRKRSSKETAAFTGGRTANPTAQAQAERLPPQADQTGLIIGNGSINNLAGENANNTPRDSGPTAEENPNGRSNNNFRIAGGGATVRGDSSSESEDGLKGPKESPNTSDDDCDQKPSLLSNNASNKVQNSAFSAREPATVAHNVHTVQPSTRPVVKDTQYIETAPTTSNSALRFKANVTQSIAIPGATGDLEERGMVTEVRTKPLGLRILH